MLKTVQRRVVLMVLSLIVLSGVLLNASSAPVAAQTQTVPQTATLVAISAASHPEATPQYDRVVFEFKGRLPESIRVEYVSKLIADASGAVVPIKGKGIVQLVVSPAMAHTSAGKATVPARISYRLPLVKEVVRSGDFEGVVSYGIGVAQKTEMRFMTLTNPTRIVIDFLQR
jgi:hypothetical protein